MEKKPNISDRSTDEKPLMMKITQGAFDSSLGISIVVSLAIGFLLGYWLDSLFHSKLWLIFGIFIGICSAINNVYKAYLQQKMSYKQDEIDFENKNK